MSENKRLLRSSSWIIPINCDNPDVLRDALEKGLWFRTKAIEPEDWYQKINSRNRYKVEKQNFGFYYKSQPYTVYKGQTKDPDVFCAKCVCVTSRTTRYTKFYHIGAHSKEVLHVYTGKELEDLILSDVNSWAKQMTPQTMRAMSCKWFVPYLHALPQEILLQEGFVDRIKTSLEEGFTSRKASQKLVRAANEILDDCVTLKKEGKLAFDKRGITKDK